MTRGIERRNIFQNDNNRNDLIGRLCALLPEIGTACYAWTLIMDLQVQTGSDSWPQHRLKFLKAAKRRKGHKRKSCKGALSELRGRIRGTNTAFYYTMLVAFFLYESFKEDVWSEVVQVSAYATTLRRKIIDFAAKIVSHSGYIALKVNRAVLASVKLVTLWKKSVSAQPPY